MTRYLALATLGLMVLGTHAIAQTVAPSPIKLQLVIARYEGDKKVSSQPFELRLLPNQQGTLRVSKDIKDLPPSELVPCITPASSNGQQVGTTVESMVRPMGDEFSVQLTITERALAGCRTVGNIDIPVFSNRVVAHTVRLKNGETTDVMQADTARNTSTRMEVAVTREEKQTPQ
jgi:hypothetical protein